MGILGLERLYKLLDGLQIRQVELHQPDIPLRILLPNFGSRFFPLLQIATGHDHGRAPERQPERDLIPETAVRAGHQCQLSGLIGDIFVDPVGCFGHAISPSIIIFAKE